MRKLTLLALAPLILIGYWSAGARPAHAATTMTTQQAFARLEALPSQMHQMVVNRLARQGVNISEDYDIESQGFHCSSGAAICNFHDMAAVTYSGVSAVYLGPQSAATPTYIMLICGRGYYDTAGMPHILMGHNFTGTAAGRPGGFAAVGPNPTETNTRATGTMNV